MKFHVVTCSVAASMLAACASGGKRFNSERAKRRAAPARASATSSSTYTVVDLGTLGGAVERRQQHQQPQLGERRVGLTSSSYVHAALWKNGGFGNRPRDVRRPEQRRRMARQERPRCNFRHFGNPRQTTPRRNLVVCVNAFSRSRRAVIFAAASRGATAEMVKLPTLGGNNGFAAGANDFGHDRWLGRNAQTRLHLHQPASSRV